MSKAKSKEKFTKQFSLENPAGIEYVVHMDKTWSRSLQIDTPVNVKFHKLIRIES